ncbi:pentatricopeptide repeat-containing protein At4g26680, mitochondrial [Aristolochia californica]|uniref:pentatricopeptide repeat-containing protein At4g26680, mitochondrial n=1 Tax=Aristolochia californica TaxID=171875 RepID=UPI0035DB17CF
MLGRMALSSHVGLDVVKQSRRFSSWSLIQGNKLHCFSLCPSHIRIINKVLLRNLSQMADVVNTTPVSALPNVLQRGKTDFLPLPHCSIPEPKGQDLDFINVAYSHLIHTDWVKLNSLSSGLNPFRIKHILLKIYRDPILSLEFFDWVELQKPNSSTPEVHAIILHILTKGRQFKTAESLLKRNLVPKKSPLEIFDALLYSYRLCDSSPRVFDSLFKTYAHMKKFRNATDTFCRMRDYGFLPAIESCNAYMSSLLDLRRADIVLAFYKEMCRCRISPNVYTLNMIISAFCKLGKLEKAVDVFKEMENMGCAPTVASYNSLITGYCNHDLISAALKLKISMPKNGLQPNVVTYNTLIDAFCKKGNMHEANKIFNEMKAIEVSPNTVTYNILIHGYGKLGNSEMGIRLYEQMLKNGMQVDILTYNALVLGLCKEGKTRKASHMLKKIEKEDLTPNASTFAALIIGQCQRQNSERAFLFFKHMKKSGFYPTVDILHMIVAAFMKNKDYEGAAQILLEMLVRSIALTGSLLVEIFEGLHESGKAHLIARLYTEAEKRQLFPEGFKKNKVIPT